jgi:magnesium transporter
MANLPKPTLRRSARRARLAAPAPEPQERKPNVETIAAEGLRWVNIERPSPLECAWLEEHFGFHALDLEDVLSRNQRPKIDEYPDYMFIVLHVPHYNKERARLDAAELNVFVGHGYIVTLPNVPLKPLGRLFAQLEDNQERREEYFAKGSGYVLYEILSELFDYCFPILDKIGFKLDRLRDAIFTERRSEEVVRDISDVKHEIVSYRKVIQPERSTLRLLERTRYLPDDLEVYFDDIVDKAERIWDQLDNYKEVVEALEATNESVIAHKQNDILRLLTIFSVILLPLTLISGIFGMNFSHIPFSQNYHGFIATVGVMLAIAIVMLTFFRIKRWI